MKPRQTLLLIIIFALTFIFSLPIIRTSPPLILLRQNMISLDGFLRENAQSLFAVKIDDFGQPLSLSDSEMGENSSAFSNAISQPLILEEQLNLTQLKVNEAKHQLDLLYEQLQILTEESAAYKSMIVQKYLTPLNKIQRQIPSSEDDKSQSLALATQQSIDIITVFIDNPNEQNYDSQLESVIQSIDKTLNGEEIPHFLTALTHLFEFGPHQTRHLLNLTKIKNLLLEFDALIHEGESESLTAYKKTKRQEAATTNAIEVKSTELDDLLLKLTGILDEIEEVTQ